MPKGNDWTTHEERYLREHYYQQSAKTLARQLNRTVGAIYGKAQKLGLYSAAPTGKLDLDELTELIQFGYSSNDIGRILNVSGGTVRRTIRKRQTHLHRLMLANGKRRQRTKNN